MRDVIPHFRRGSQHLRDDLAIGGGRETDAALEQPAAQVQRVGQVAVVSHPQRAVNRLDQIGLRVAEMG